MISFFLLLGIIQICRAIRWDVPSGQSGIHDLNHYPLNHHTMLNRDPHTWNQIGEVHDRKSIKGPEAWLAEVIIGKDHHGYVKPIIKEFAYPVYKNMEIKIPYPQIQQEPQRYPILIPMLQQIPYEVIKTIVKTVEKKVPTPIEKIVPMAVEKPVPFEVIKHVPMFVEKRIPIKIPVYKTIHHRIS